MQCDIAVASSGAKQVIPVDKDNMRLLIATIAVVLMILLCCVVVYKFVRQATWEDSFKKFFDFLVDMF